MFVEENYDVVDCKHDDEQSSMRNETLLGLKRSELLIMITMMTRQESGIEAVKRLIGLLIRLQFPILI